MQGYVMGRGRRLPLLTLTIEDRETLQGWSRRRKTAQALALCSRIVLRASTGLTATAIALEQGVCIQTVSKWWRRYAVSGPDSQLDEARPGQPRKLAMPTSKGSLCAHWRASRMVPHTGRRARWPRPPG